MEKENLPKKKFSRPEVDVIEELTAKLIKANSQLKLAEEERTRMLENISHDLRAPLTAIRGCVDYLKTLSDDEKRNRTDFVDDEYKKVVKLLDMRTKSMEMLVKDLYYLICIDNGKDDMHFEDIPLAQFLEEYFYALEIDEKYKNHKLYLDVDENLLCTVKIDTTSMTRVLDNLFTNARKYSPEGEIITLGAYIAQDEELKKYPSLCNNKVKEQFAVFYVKDTGIGIDEKYVEKIFDRLFMVSDARTPSGVKGSGLGLSIVDSIVKKHGGKVVCESKVGVGSCFKVFLKCS